MPPPPDPARPTGRADDRLRRPTVRDVAERAGVGQGTAARVLGGYGAFSDKARSKVEAAAQELGYSANGIARSMIKGTTHTIGVVIADIENSFFARATRGITDVARAAGYQVLLANTDNDHDAERDAVRVLLEMRVDGIIAAVAPSRNIDHLQQIKTMGVPLVLLDRRAPGLKVDTVLSDNRHAGQVAVEYLAAHGHRRIAAVAPSRPGSPAGAGLLNDLPTSLDRLAGFRAGLHNAGLEADPNYICHAGLTRESAAKAALQLLSLSPRPTAIFTTNDSVAPGVLDAAHELGLSVPRDLSLIVLDDAEWSTLLRPQLTVIAQPVYELGQHAANAVLNRLGGDSAPPRKLTLRTQIIERESVAHLG